MDLRQQQMNGKRWTRLSCILILQEVYHISVPRSLRQALRRGHY